MENRINQVVSLQNGKKYIVLKQAIYQKRIYYFAAEITSDEENLTGQFVMFEQINENGEDYLKIVKDKDILNILAKYFGKNE